MRKIIPCCNYPELQRTEDRVVPARQFQFPGSPEVWPGNGTDNSYYKDHCSDNKPEIINPDKVSRLIDTLRHNASPGIDGVTAEHLQYGKSDILCSILASLV